MYIFSFSERPTTSNAMAAQRPLKNNYSKNCAKSKKISVIRGMFCFKVTGLDIAALIKTDTAADRNICR